MGLLFERALTAGNQECCQWLPCDSAVAVAVPCERVGSADPYTRSTAWDAGWQWRIPLQHRIGNGHVHASRHTDHGTAREILLANLDSEPAAEPRPLRFTTSKRVDNCVAVGPSGGFLEPLETTPIRPIQSSINKLMSLFPRDATDPAMAAMFKRLMDAEFETVRDLSNSIL